MSEPAVIINVDDNEPSRYARSRILSHAGFVVYDAATGGDFLELFAKLEPDLVLLDINLPDLNGIGSLSNAEILPRWSVGHRASDLRHRDRGSPCDGGPQ